MYIKTVNCTIACTGPCVANYLQEFGSAISLSPTLSLREKNTDRQLYNSTVTCSSYFFSEKARRRHCGSIVSFVDARSYDIILVWGKTDSGRTTSLLLLNVAGKEFNLFWQTK